MLLCASDRCGRVRFTISCFVYVFSYNSLSYIYGYSTVLTLRAVFGNGFVCAVLPIERLRFNSSCRFYRDNGVDDVGGELFVWYLLAEFLFTRVSCCVFDEVARLTECTLSKGRCTRARSGRFHELGLSIGLIDDVGPGRV